MAIVRTFGTSRRRRRALGVAAVVLVALGAGYGGQFLQGGAADRVPRQIVLLSAGSTAPVQSLLEMPEAIAAAPLMPEIFALERPATLLAPKAPSKAQDCAMDLDLGAVADAMIRASVRAPCRAGERVVLRHAGLAVTGRIGEAGQLEVLLPALQDDARLEVAFGDGQVLEQALRIEGANLLRRFGVQWQGPEAFAVHGFENGADFGQPGHVSPARPDLAEGGKLTILGDPGVEAPLLAQIYTYPAGLVPVEVLVEASVTPLTCGQDLLGEVISAQGGLVDVTDLTLSMPDCAAGDGFLVLKNLAAEMKLAAK